MSGRRYLGRPGAGDILGMLCVNAFVALIVQKIVFSLFDIGEIMAERFAEAGMAEAPGEASLFWLMLPGAALGFTWLWVWLALTGRSQRGVAWGGALFYGALIALCNVPFSGLLFGLLTGNPLLGLLLGLVGLLLLPALTPAMTAYGLTLGAFNGWKAARFIERHRPRD